MKLKLIKDNLVIPQTSGKRIIPEKTKLFSWIDADFRNWGAYERGEPKPETKCALYELVEDATFEEMLKELGDPEKLCMTWEQIIKFIKKYKGELKEGKSGVFFLFRSYDELFIAYVYAKFKSNLCVTISHFENSLIMNGHNNPHVVVPQLPAHSETEPVDLDGEIIELKGRKYKLVRE